MNEVPIMTKVIDKFEQHRIARMEADKNRIVSAQKWVDTVERMGENVSSRQERLMFIDSLSKAKEQLRRQQKEKLGERKMNQYGSRKSTELTYEQLIFKWLSENPWQLKRNWQKSQVRQLRRSLNILVS